MCVFKTNALDNEGGKGAIMSSQVLEPDGDGVRTTITAILTSW